MTEGITRKQAVSKFYSLLVLAKQEATLLSQNQTFGDVFIRKGPKFDAVLMWNALQSIDTIATGPFRPFFTPTEAPLPVSGP